MNRPYIICHMVTSIDGKVTGDFLYRPECNKPTDVYYEINRNLKCNGFICGRVTMEESFTNGWYPNLDKYKPIGIKMDYILDVEDLSGFYAVAFDPKGKLGWKSNKIKDEDSGYDKAQIIEVVTEQVDDRYLAYLQSKNIPYIFAGETDIDVNLALFKLRNIFGIDMLLLEGGSIINGSFLRADVIDELSLVVAPVIADEKDKPLFTDSELADFELAKVSQIENVVVLNYLKKSNRCNNDLIRIHWEDAMTIDEAIASDSSDIQGLYYITRVFGHKETTLYLGIATKHNTVRNRLKGHLSWWLKEYRGTIKVRIGRVVYPFTNLNEVIDHSESAILAEQGDLFIENISKTKSYTYNNLYRVENVGDIFELKSYIDMNKHC